MRGDHLVDDYLLALVGDNIMGILTGLRVGILVGIFWVLPWVSDSLVGRLWGVALVEHYDVCIHIRQWCL